MAVSWKRLEPASRDAELTPGLEARIHDPLWLLARQWQLGEFAAQTDLGSAIAVEVTARVAPLTQLTLGATAQAYDVRAAPLEALAEAEDIRVAPTVRARVRAGQHFERLLAARGVGQYADAYRRAYAIDPPADPVDQKSRRFGLLIAHRAIDGARLYRDLTSGGGTLPAEPAVDQAHAAAVRDAASAWLEWANELVFAPEGGPAAWVQERLEYAFGLSAADHTVLAAAEHADGRLDWHSFDDAEAPTGIEGTRQLGPLITVPSAVTYPGMPASRLWEFEDARVDFGAVEADATDLGRMLLAEFALVFGGDWLLVPLEVPVGALVEIDRLEVRDTFGRTLTIGPTADSDASRWGMFGLSAADGSHRNALLVAPALAASLQGRIIEEVLLLRDETANLAWAVERTVEGDDGLPADRAQGTYERHPPVGDPPGTEATERRTYRLRTDVPEHWLPLLPHRDHTGDPSMTFHLGALTRRNPDGTAQPVLPLGRLLQPSTAEASVVIREEEVPREGRRVTRSYQLARWIDGTTFLWLGRRASVGRGEGSSGLRFDIAES